MPRRLAERIAQRASVLSNLDDLTTRERVDVLLNDPGSVSASVIRCRDDHPHSRVHGDVLRRDVTVVLRRPNRPSNPFLAIEASCIATFTAELSLRFWATDDRNGFFKRGMNVVDLVAIVPFYVDLIARAGPSRGCPSFARFAWRAVFRLLKVSKTAVDLLGRTMSRSARPLYILGFLLIISLITFAAVLYFAERGEYDETPGCGCARPGSSAIPCDARTYDFTPAFLAFGDARIADAGTVVSAYFDRHVPSVSSVGATCERVVEQSPFQSILHAVWWAVATMGTVGYGDIAPRTLAGWILASLAQMMGILVIALPITVIGSNFSAIYSSIGTSQSLAPRSTSPPRRPSRAACTRAARRHRRQAHRLGGMVGLCSTSGTSTSRSTSCCRARRRRSSRTETTARTTRAVTRATRDERRLRSSRSRRGPANSWQMTRLLTPEQQIEAFLKGEDLHENPTLSARGGGIADAGGPRCWRRARRKPRERKVPPGRARPERGAARGERRKRQKRQKRQRRFRKVPEGVRLGGFRSRSAPVRAPEGFAQVGPRAQSGAVRARGGVFGAPACATRRCATSSPRPAV